MSSLHLAGVYALCLGALVGTSTLGCAGASPSSSPANGPVSPPPSPSPAEHTHPPNANPTEPAAAAQEPDGPSAVTSGTRLRPGESEVLWEDREQTRSTKVTAHRQALMRRLDKTSANSEAQDLVPRHCLGTQAPAAASDAGDPTTQASTTDPTTANEMASPESAAAAPPSSSGPGSTPCYPPLDYVEKLCASNYPSVALVMFQEGSPWVRGYLRGETKAWTTTPGAQQNDRLAQDEEVLILQGQAVNTDGIRTDEGASFYALRWDGTCVKLTEEEMATTPPWRKRTPRIQWKWLDDDHQRLLREDPKIDELHRAQRKQCRGSSGASAPAQCQQLEQRLSDLVVASVRKGKQLPDPKHRP